MGLPELGAPPGGRVSCPATAAPPPAIRNTTEAPRLASEVQREHMGPHRRGLRHRARVLRARDRVGRLPLHPADGAVGIRHPPQPLPPTHAPPPPRHPPHRPARLTPPP